MLSIQEKIIDELAEHYLDILIRQVVKAIQKVPKSAMTSGQDSGLKNAWDEICVQVQDERFDSWDLLDDMVGLVSEDKYDQLPYPVKAVLSYSACIRLGEEPVSEDFPEMSLAIIKEEVYRYAGKYKNKQIQNYLDR